MRSSTRSSEDPFLYPDSRNQDLLGSGQAGQVVVDHGGRENDVGPVFPQAQLGDPLVVGEAGEEVDGRPQVLYREGWPPLWRLWRRRPEFASASMFPPVATNPAGDQYWAGEGMRRVET